MNWDVEISKKVSMIMLVIVLMIIFWNYKKIQKVNMYFFSGFILLSVIDLFCYFYFKTTKKPTDTFYILGVFGAFFLYLLYYYRLFYIPFLKKTQLLFLMVFWINIGVMMYFNPNFFGHFSFSIFYVNILLLTFSVILFLYQTFNSDKIFRIKNYLPFWISVACLIFYIGIIPIIFFRNTVSLNIYFFILFLLNLINNAIIIFGLILNKPEKT
ncbi:hypothetical protein [Chryseobacterium binzhouense]|uniref:hypothetical protein n=1 Tax=Chryseobacterium binzhouense TaxID=2593646 RepID=UPI00289849E6|nr:hypothetical protein [Chryseobacterium binzhouense]